MISYIFQIYIYIIILDVILSWIPDLRSQKWAQYVHKAADVTLRPIREMMPQGMPIDLSPWVVIILCQILMYLFQGI